VLYYKCRAQGTHDRETTMAAKQFSQGSFENALVARLVKLVRSRGKGGLPWSLMVGKAKAALVRQGYRRDVADAVVTGCEDMAELQLACWRE
jgi:hypothetical protein